MAAATHIPITGSVLTWAMREAGIDDALLAKRAKVPSSVVQDWQQERSQPTKTQFGKIVETVRRPSAIFFLPAPPTDASTPTALRSAPALKGRQLSPEALREIRTARRIQRIIGWLLASEDSAALPPIPSYDWRTTPPAQAGAAARAAFEVPLAEQVAWANTDRALRAWRGIFDDHGVLVFFLTLGKQEIRGFSAWDDHAPMVAANTAYNSAARIFTMAHELGHLVAHTDSACRDWVGPEATDDLALERWCEQFASAFLLPPADVIAYLRTQFNVTPANPVETIPPLFRIAAKLKVSARAMTLMLIAAGLAPSSLYDEVAKNAKVVDRPPDRTASGGQPKVKQRLAQYGARPPSVILESVRTGALDTLDAADYLRVKVGELDDLASALRDARAVAG